MRSQTPTANDPLQPAASQAELQADALGLLGTVSLTAAFMAPAASLIALFGPIVANAGVAGGFVMFLGLMVTLPSAVSLGMLAKELPSAGGIFTWARQTLGARPGRWVGLTTACYYIVLLVFPPIVFGQMMVALVSDLGWAIPAHLELWVWLAGALLSLMIAGYSLYRGIVVSSHLAFAMLILQLIVMSALAGHFLYLAIAQDRLSWAPFLPTASANGWSGIYLALPLAMLSLVCDGATPASEETKDAKRTIPIAIFCALLMVGTWDVLAFGALGMAAPGPELVTIASDPVVNPVPVLAERIWGPMKMLVTVVGMIAMLGALVPCGTASSRLLLSLGRDGTLPAWLSRVHPRYRTPWNALTVVFIITVLAVIPMAFRLGPISTINWWGIIVGWLILCVYFAANLCNIIYYWRFRPEKFHLVWNLVTPIFAMSIQVVVFWQIVIRGPFEAGWFGRTAQLFIVVLAVASAVYVLALRREISRPKLDGAGVAEPEQVADIAS